MSALKCVCLSVASTFNYHFPRAKTNNIESAKGHTEDDHICTSLLKLKVAECIVSYQSVYVWWSMALKLALLIGKHCKPKEALDHSLYTMLSELENKLPFFSTCELNWECLML